MGTITPTQPCNILHTRAAKYSLCCPRMALRRPTACTVIGCQGAGGWPNWPLLRRGSCCAPGDWTSPGPPATRQLHQWGSLHLATSQSPGSKPGLKRTAPPGLLFFLQRKHPNITFSFFRFTLSLSLSLLSSLLSSFFFPSI